MSYEVWTHDGARPELLCEREDKGLCRRAWMNSKHAAIVAGGAVLESKTGAGEKQLKAIAAAAAYAHRTGGEPLLDVPPPGPRSGPPRMVRPELPLTVERVEAMPARRAVAVVEADDSELVRLRRALDAVTRERDGYRTQVEGLTSDLATTKRLFNELGDRHQADLARLTADLDTARRDAAAHLVRAVEAEAQRDAVTADRVAQVAQLVADLDARDADYQRALSRCADTRDELTHATIGWTAALDALRSAAGERDCANEECEQLRAATRPTLDEALLRRVVADAVAATRTDLRLRALAATLPGGVGELERLVLGYGNLLRSVGG